MQPHENAASVTVELARLRPAEEVDKAAATAGVRPAPASELALYGPLDYQVFQRKTRTQGEVRVRGRVHADFDRVEWRLTGNPLEGAAPFEWQALPASGEPRAFDAVLPAPAGGWYKLEVRALKDGKEIATGAVDHVGVGEVFVGAGQSNSTNCGQFKTQQHTGLVSSFGGTYWQPADDPQPGAHDDSAGGSFWPAFGDAMAEKYHVPIGVASTEAVDACTSINPVAAGRPGGTVRLDHGAHERAGMGRLPGRPVAPGRVGHRHVLGRVPREADQSHRKIARRGRLGHAVVRGPGVLLCSQGGFVPLRPATPSRSCGMRAWRWRGRTPTRSPATTATTTARAFTSARRA